MAAKPTFTYFAGRGRAYAARVGLFKAFGKDGWNNALMDFADWPAAKPNAPLASLPTLTLPDGRVITQCESIARWAASKSGLYPTADPDAALVVDEASAVAFEALGKAPGADTPEEKKKVREAYGAGFLKLAMTLLEGRLAADASGPFILGATLTYADLVVFGLVQMILDGEFDFIPPEYMGSYPLLTAHAQAVTAHELVTSYHAAGYAF